MVVTIGDLIRPARGAMILSGILTAIGAVLAVVPFIALRHMAAIWLQEGDLQGWASNPWVWAVIAVVALFASHHRFLLVDDRRCRPGECRRRPRLSVIGGGECPAVWPGGVVLPAGGGFAAGPAGVSVAGSG